MPTPEALKAPFSPGDYYHIVCKSIDGILLFNEEKDYKVFQERFKKFIHDFADTWCYTLMNNHTHHICKIRPADSILSYITTLPDVEKTKSMLEWAMDVTNIRLFDNMMERQMNRFMVSFANYINNKYSRKGGVFQSPFKRIKITDQNHLQQAIVYVNANAQKHHIVKDFRLYRYSSYAAMIKAENYFCDTKSVLEFFGGKENFIKTHTEQVDYFYNKGWPSSKLE